VIREGHQGLDLLENRIILSYIKQLSRAIAAARGV